MDYNKLTPIVEKAQSGDKAAMNELLEAVYKDLYFHAKKAVRDEHLAEDLSIESLSEEFFISKYHMMRLFRQETGQSIHAYLSDRRLLHARDLITQGFSATDSCFRSGFGSYSSFTRAYAKRFGTTPTGRSTQLDETYE